VTDPIQLDPATLTTATRARYRQELAKQAEHAADLLDEIAHLETYVAQLSAQLAKGTHDES
jgi:hypothetical protein